MGRPAHIFSPAAIQLMQTYMVAHQQSDGGWGTHIESPSTMFGTTMMYVALRCLGLEKDGTYRTVVVMVWLSRWLS